MIRINLLPFKELQAEVTRRRQLVIGGGALGLAAILLIGIHLLQSHRLSSLETELVGLRADLQTLNTKIKEVGDLQTRIKDLRGKNKIIADLNKKKSGPVLVMESLANATPATLWLTDLKEAGGSVTLNGVASDNRSIADFMTSLEGSKHFKSVELIEATQGIGPTAGFKKFAIKTAVMYQPAEPAPADSKAKPAASAAKKEEKKS
ncbi:MAG TPA: PilN domain-containing protein [Candidatus Binatia bacterium]